MKFSAIALSIFAVGLSLLGQVQAGDSKATSEVERFSVRGIKTGMTIPEFAAVAVNIGSKNEHPDPTNRNDNGEATIGPESDKIAPIRYMAVQYYTNGKNDADQSSVIGRFTAPVPGGQEGKLWEITYTTGFGEGVSPQKVVDDLVAKYGPAKPRKSYLQTAWEYPEWSPSQKPGGIHVSIKVTEPFATIHYGVVSVEIQNLTIRDKVEEELTAYFDKLENERPKATTQPKF